MLSLVAPFVIVSLQASAVPPAPAPASRQQIFEAATKAREEKRCADAIRGFESLEAKRPTKPNPTVDAIVSVRKGWCLATLDRAGEAEVALRSGLKVLEPLAAQYEGDVYEARMMLARLALLNYDYATAQAEAERALALCKDLSRVESLLLLARITMFDEDETAIAFATEAVRLIGQFSPKDKESLAVARTAHARALLNMGRHKEAYAELKAALALQGGLGLRVGLTDILTRSDLAFAAVLAGDEEQARTYMAYTGAGRTGKVAFSNARVMETPLCAGDAGLRPEDSTIVEFTLRATGDVAAATPIYSTGNRQVALLFAQSVMAWSWSPENAAAIPPLFRAAARVELRCSMVGERPGVMSVLAKEFRRWAEAKGLRPIDGGNAVKTAALARAELARLPAGDNGLARLAALYALGTNPVVPPAGKIADLSEALQRITAAGAPIGPRSFVALQQLEARPYEKDGARTRHAVLRAMLADPEILADAAAGGTVRLLLATPGYKRPAPADAQALVAAVAGDARLPADDPLKINALLQQASLASAAGDIDAARATFAKTGLDEEQCALIGATPALAGNAPSSSDFPLEAMRLGFEGWVRLEFDILASGRTTAVRPIIAYPPFVFNKASSQALEGARFQSSYRPSGGAACVGKQQTIVFRLPK